METEPKSMTPLEAFVTQVNRYQLGLAGLSAGKVLVTGRAFKDVIGGHPGSFVESTYSGLHGGLTDFLGTAWQSSLGQVPAGSISIGSMTIDGVTYPFSGRGDIPATNSLRDSFQIDKRPFSDGQGFNRQAAQSLPTQTPGGGFRINGRSMTSMGSQIFPNSYIGPGDPRCQWDGC